MKVEIEVPEYSPGQGIRTQWDDGFEITVTMRGNVAHIVANPAGLRSLARHLLLLARDEMPEGHHIHLDASNSLEEGSDGLILERA